MRLLAVAASGGADSTALIAEAANHFPAQHVTVLSVDHRTRASASAERCHVRTMASRFGFAFQELRIGPVATNQAAWRAARLDALLDYCRDNRIGCLWLGHNRDDAVETAALRLLAGGNLPSLAGISAVRCLSDVRVERPLLNRSARAIRRGLMARGYAWYEDPSNRQERYRRVAIRRLLTGVGRGNAADLVHRTGEWRERRDLLIASAWEQAASRGAHGSLWLSPAVMRGLPDGLAAALLRRAALTASGREQRLRNVDFADAVRRDPVMQDLGGAKLWSADGRWLIGRDYRHIQVRLPLIPGQAQRWDARYALRLKTDLGREGWQAARLGLHAARRLQLNLPAAWAAAALAIWCGKELVAVPDLAVWLGEHGAELAKNLAWRRLPAMDTGLFRVAPRQGAPILRLYQ